MTKPIIVELFAVEDWNNLSSKYNIKAVDIDFECPNCKAELFKINSPADPFLDQMIYCNNGHRVVAKHAELFEEDDGYLVKLILEVLEHQKEWI